MLKGKKTEGVLMGPAEISGRLEQLNAEIRRLDCLQYDLAAQSVDDPKVEADYQKCVFDSISAQKERDRLQSALIGIGRQEKRVALTSSISGRHANIQELEAVVGARLTAISEIVNGIEAATTGYARFIAACDQLQLALAPFGAVALPMESPQSLEIVADEQPPMAALPACALAAEMHRIGGVLHLALPGAKAPTLQVIDRPELIQPLLESAARQSEAILAAVREHAARVDANETAKLEIVA